MGTLIAVRGDLGRAGLLERVVQAVTQALRGREHGCVRVDVELCVSGPRWRCTIRARRGMLGELSLTTTGCSSEDALSTALSQLRGQLAGRRAA